ncbi:MAG: T9SS type A sorting domain-containing protein, partial [Bacteroidales bacterium]|nr:T9SS type A sorting domain-containing protein [Bacteroidales bacterium]
SELGVWLTATFDEDVYLDGQTIWVTVELLQTAGEYPLTMDGGHYGAESDGNWLSTQGGSFDHCYSAGDFEGAWLITVNCEGQLIPGTWATLSQETGSIPGGQSQTIYLTLNSIGLAMGTSYNANLVINTNDENLPQVMIPVLLAVTDGVEETAEQMASIYPNPATSMVTLEGENLNSVAIYNVAGQLIRVEKLGAMVNNINMDVEAGVYFFSVYDNNGNNSVQRVVIVK